VDRKRLDLALSGIFEVRELPDLTLAGFSTWEDAGKSYWAQVLFNRRHQLLSVQIHPEPEVSEMMSKGVAIWTDTEKNRENPALKLKLESVDLLTGTVE
jgi:hypothetical protein